MAAVSSLSGPTDSPNVPLPRLVPATCVLSRGSPSPRWPSQSWMVNSVPSTHPLSSCPPIKTLSAPRNSAVSSSTSGPRRRQTGYPRPVLSRAPAPRPPRVRRTHRATPPSAAARHRHRTRLGHIPACCSGVPRHPVTPHPAGQFRLSHSPVARRRPSPLGPGPPATRRHPLLLRHHRVSPPSPTAVQHPPTSPSRPPARTRIAPGRRRPRQQRLAVCTPRSGSTAQPARRDGPSRRRPSLGRTPPGLGVAAPRYRVCRSVRLRIGYEQVVDGLYRFLAGDEREAVSLPESPLQAPV